MTAFTFYSDLDDTKLYGKNWPVSNPKAILLIVPGFGDHCERYQYLQTFFYEHNIAVVGIDLRGQGRSNGERGYTPSVKAYLEDLKSGIEKVHDLYPTDLPLFVHCDGIAAGIVCLYTDRLYTNPLSYQGVIACTPSISTPKKPNFIHLALIRAFAALTPHTRAPIVGADYKYTDDEEVIKAYKTDPHVHDRWPGKTASLLCEAALYFEENGCKFSVPTLIQHGSKAFLPMQKVRDWVKKSSGKITFKEWEDLHAELHNDKRRNEVFEYTLSWIEEQLELLKNSQKAS
jgi:acylglycerol lipase